MPFRRDARFARKLAAAQATSVEAGWSEASHVLVTLTGICLDIPGSARSEILSVIKSGLAAHASADAATRRIRSLTSEETAAESAMQKLQHTISAVEASQQIALRDSVAAQTLRGEMARIQSALGSVRSEMDVQSRAADEALDQSRSCLRRVEALAGPAATPQTQPWQRNHT